MGISEKSYTDVTYECDVCHTRKTIQRSQGGPSSGNPPVDSEDMSSWGTIQVTNLPPPLEDRMRSRLENINIHNRNPHRVLCPDCVDKLWEVLGGDLPLDSLPATRAQPVAAQAKYFAAQSSMQQGNSVRLSGPNGEVSAARAEAYYLTAQSIMQQGNSVRLAGPNGEVRWYQDAAAARKELRRQRENGNEY